MAGKMGENFSWLERGRSVAQKFLFGERYHLYDMKPSQVHAIPPEHLEEPMQVAEHMVEPMDVVANECSTLLAPSFIFAFKNNFDKRSQTGFQKQQANYT